MVSRPRQNPQNQIYEESALFVNLAFSAEKPEKQVQAVIRRCVASRYLWCVCVWRVDWGQSDGAWVWCFFPLDARGVCVVVAHFITSTHPEPCSGFCSTSCQHIPTNLGHPQTPFISILAFSAFSLIHFCAATFKSACFRGYFRSHLGREAK